MVTTENVTHDAADMAASWSGAPAHAPREWWFYGLLQLVDYYESALARGGVDFASGTFNRAPAIAPPRIGASLASAAEHFAARDGWDAPRWARAQAPLDEEWFVDEVPAFCSLQRRESPPAFAKRRIYVFANALERA